MAMGKSELKLPSIGVKGAAAGRGEITGRNNVSPATHNP